MIAAGHPPRCGKVLDKHGKLIGGPTDLSNVQLGNIKRHTSPTSTDGSITVATSSASIAREKRS